MPASIPASELVNVTPGVITAAGLADSLNGLMVTGSTRVPIGSVVTFGDTASVQAYFGPSSTEATLADNYFRANDNSTSKPAQLAFAQYAAAAVSGYVRGGSLASIDLATLKTYTGTMTVTVDGVAKTSSSISLTAATSFSNAATIIQAAFTSPNFTVTYDSIASAFVITSSTTGATSTVVVTTGAFATNIRMTAATGAVTSPGAAAMTPGSAMTGVLAVFQNFAAFMTTFEPSASDKVLFAAWTNSQANRVAYAMWDTATAPTTSSDTTSAGYQVYQADYSGVIPIWGPASVNVAAMVLGTAAALDFDAAEGRTTLAYRSQSGLVADVTDLTTARNLVANHYNYYGAFANANSSWNFFQKGTISGDFLWADSYFNQIWMNASFQLNLLALLQNSNSLPYNVDGYTAIEQSLMPTITAALNFGAIRAGVELDAQQRAAVRARAGGRDIAPTLTARGWYILVLPASSSTRVARESPPITVFYMDGQSIQKLDLASIQIQ